MICKKPDRDVPELICGHPLPCPYHTITIDLKPGEIPTVIIPATEIKRVNPKTLNRLKKIARILKRGTEEK